MVRVSGSETNLVVQMATKTPLEIWKHLGALWATLSAAAIVFPGAAAILGEGIAAKNSHIATYYGFGAGYYLGASILPHWWWHDFYYLHLHGLYLGHHHDQLAHQGHGLVAHDSIGGSAGHHASRLAVGHVGHEALLDRGDHLRIGHDAAFN